MSVKASLIASAIDYLAGTGNAVITQDEHGVEVVSPSAEQIEPLKALVIKTATAPPDNVRVDLSAIYNPALYKIAIPAFAGAMGLFYLLGAFTRKK